MIPIIFDGRSFAKEKEEKLQQKVLQLKKKNITPKLVSLVIGDIDGAMKYQEMKKKVGERVGVEVEIVGFKIDDSRFKIETTIEKLNNDPTVHGIMIQLPLPKHFSQEDKFKLINSIKPEKDVDGMREESRFTSPVVLAVLDALQQTSCLQKNGKWQMTNGKLGTIVVVGAKGFEGRKIVKRLEILGYRVQGIDKSDFESHLDPKPFNLNTFDIVISCTGVPNLITGYMIKNNVICIDVGAPKGDFEFETVSPKASFITPVPGGIGPVTIINLMENVVEASKDIVDRV